MDEEAKLPVRTAASRNLSRPVGQSNLDTTTSSTSSTVSSCSSPPDLVRHVQAAFKRHRPLGPMSSNDLKPRRIFLPSRNPVRTALPTTEPEKSKEDFPQSQDFATKEPIVQRLHTKDMVALVKETHEDTSITPPSLSATMTKSFDESFSTFDVKMNQQKSAVSSEDKDSMPLSHVESQIDRSKKVQFSVGNSTISQGPNEGVATELRNLSSHISSLALTEMDWNLSSHIEASTLVNQDLKHQTLPNGESDVSSKSDVDMSSSLAKSTVVAQDQLQQFRNFLNQPATQSSIMGTSCATTTSVHSTSAPMLNSSTYYIRSHRDEESHMAVEPVGDSNLNHESLNQGYMMQLPGATLKKTDGMLAEQGAVTARGSLSSITTPAEDHKCKEEMRKIERGSDLQKYQSSNDDGAVELKKCTADVTNVQSQAPFSRESSLDIKSEPSQPGKPEKVGSSRGASVPRKRNYDPDLFFKVNGKLYQRLGKIGSGGSSEVHKVISSDCTIYALKKIKLKGRDYATAYGFCQEIGYLNKLKGKNNIIQLIDHEVTDKTLLHEVMNGSMSSRDGRVKDDGYIYMVLEYGEIDLAHMLSQKWKELDGSETIDENWLRFYWQQILQAVNTIHEERIVHSDLKPANFLLVKGSLKLIDFGIAKAIMSDTTNIQRDSQVGTLSYMSPEAFMCNESDANGNVIKCGRPSDIWSLGCILYQMVYGRTPFSEYKTFWSKFKVITDPNHEIAYEPVSNPWLLDIMKKCLAWDRNERWRIPQLLKHPFLVPPVPAKSQVPSQNFMLQFIAEACRNDKEASGLCDQLSKLLEDPMSPVRSQSPTRDQQCMLLSHMSKLCLQIREHLVKSAR